VSSLQLSIQSEKNNRQEIIIITDSLCTIMTAKNRTPTKNPKTQTSRKLDHEGPRITLQWVSSYVGIPGNDKTDQSAKEALDEDISTTERYPPDDLTEEDFKKSDQRWKNMWQRKINKEQVAISKLRTGYTRATHGPKMEGVSNPLCYVGAQKKLRTRE
jgi:hypothetical protein